ncbi:hypothetical protein AWB77_03618 [Caballeronia fortuita]|uniref:Replication protein O n=1 Tax=Caballeronia fortuita TaxID=1777138 RepID=A0A158C4P8_9BURK|nr:replication protein O [Caballeronia fortuita]SAK77260.1 hypothetical protein AWB77_03618 [Caballeronia fortuita]
MHIAQLSVAGEGTFRPQELETPSRQTDQQALDDYACDRSNLPWVIFRAAHRATHTTALPARARALLAALARTVDAAHPYASIFARRELLTGRAQQSMRTFYRSMDDLESAGFITRPPQTRYVTAGLFGRAYIHLTPKAATLLGLVEPASERNEAPIVRREEQRLSEADPRFAHPSATVADGAIYKDLIPNKQKRQPGRLPADLQRLLPLGFREFLIFKLMREAKAHGKLLSDVVEATWTALRRATHPISYLRTLLRAPVDFAYRVRSQRDAHAQEQVQRNRLEHIETASAELAGKSFVSRDGMRRYNVADDARSIVVRHRDEAQPRIHSGSWARDFIAALEAGHIVASDASTADSHQASAKVSLECRQKSEACLADLKTLLRLKNAGGIPSITSKDTPTPPDPRRIGPSPLGSLLQAISRTALSANRRVIEPTLHRSDE